MKEFDFAVEIIRTDRKKSAIIQIHDDKAIIKAPRTLPDAHIRTMITKRSAWIKQKLQDQSERSDVKSKEYVSGEAFSYLGRIYRLKVMKGLGSSIKMKDGYLVVTICEAEIDPPKEIKSLLQRWYRSHAEQRLREKTERLAKSVGVTPNSVAIRSYKSRWGSCSIRGDITYNWKIILAPHRIIDYVVIHELCHLLEHSHSPRYWMYVERYAPDWRNCRRWLKQHPIVF